MDPLYDNMRRVASRSRLVTGVMLRSSTSPSDSSITSVRTLSGRPVMSAGNWSVPVSTDGVLVICEPRFGHLWPHATGGGPARMPERGPPLSSTSGSPTSSRPAGPVPLSQQPIHRADQRRDHHSARTVDCTCLADQNASASVSVRLDEGTVYEVAPESAQRVHVLVLPRVRK